MKAMILAAGLGSRLKPLTDYKPKALVEVEGVPMLERIIMTLKKQGFTYIVVNVHHFAGQIIEFLDTKDFGLEIKVSDESESLLDTGGGIVKAFPLLFSDNREPVLFHNVDIISNAALSEVMYNSQGGKTDTTLLVSPRESSRKLLFSQNEALIGWHDLKNGKYRPENFEVDHYLNKDGKAVYYEYAFSGIYSMTLESVSEMKELMGNNRFSVMDYFLNPLRKKIIKGFVQRDLKLLDIGKPATLEQASGLLQNIRNSN